MRERIEMTKSTEHLPAEVVGQRVGAVTTGLQSTLNLQTRWDDNSSTVLFESMDGFAKGVTGTLQIRPGELHLVVHLPMLLRVQADAVEAQINEMFEEALK